MNVPEIKIAKRIAAAMLEQANNEMSALNLELFKGLGLALAMTFEECTGHSARNMKPKAIMEWAINLPEVKFDRIKPGD